MDFGDVREWGQPLKEGIIIRGKSQQPSEREQDLELRQYRLKELNGCGDTKN